jgi:hypothetical protein
MTLSLVALYLESFSYYSLQILSRSVRLDKLPATEKHSHSMMLPPSCFTVGMVLARWWVVPGFLQMWHLTFRPKSSIFLSSDQRILFLNVWESFRHLWQTTSGLYCAFYWGVASVWQLYHKGRVLQRWLSFWKVIPSPQRNSGTLSEW